MAMTVELATSVEDQLRDLASKQGRDVDRLVEEAIQKYIEAASVTDLDPAEVAEAQVALMGELDEIPEWKDGGA